MLSDRVLVNFQQYLSANPRGPSCGNPLGAYDAMPAKLQNNGPSIRDLSAGGAFDSVGGMVEKTMKFCRSR